MDGRGPVAVPNLHSRDDTQRLESCSKAATNASSTRLVSYAYVSPGKRRCGQLGPCQAVREGCTGLMTDDRATCHYQKGPA